MFGSKQLLIAFMIGTFGVCLTIGAMFDTLPLARLIPFAVGMCAIWVSGLFGPLMVMQEKGVAKLGDDAPSPEEP